ncbi:MAG: LPS export ABC transporter periplasmic protein LptC [Rhodospirillaceae bacterium]
MMKPYHPDLAAPRPEIIPLPVDARHFTAMPNWMRRDHHDPDGVPVDSRRHSNLVLALKIGFPLLALLLIALVAAWPQLIASQKNEARIDKNLTSMVNARYISHDRQDRPFSMIAKRATEVPGQSNLVDMISPEAEMTQSDGSWLTITSERGRYNQENGRLLMMDTVHLLRDDGFEFVTDEAEIDTKSGNAWGDHKVVGQGPSGEIRADGFNAIDHGKIITFIHSSNATISNSIGSKAAPAKATTSGKATASGKEKSK